MTIESRSSQPERAERVSSLSRSWGLALTGAIGSGKTTTVRVLEHFLGWRVVSSGDVARQIDSLTARTGAMADPDELDRVLLPMLAPGPVLLDGYPRTTRQLAALPLDFDVVFLEINEEEALRRVARRMKNGWNETQRLRQQRGGLEAVRAYCRLRIDVAGKSPGEVAFEILSSEYLGPPVGWSSK
jgi:cytidylate kinase